VPRFQARYFSLEEARALLPKVGQALAAALEAREHIRALDPEIWPLVARAVTNGGTEVGGRIVRHYKKLETAVKTILERGVFIKDLDMGLLDFLSIRDEEEVFLCWKFGEKDILFWHSLEGGFGARKPLQD